MSKRTDIDELLPATARKRGDGLNLTPKQNAFVRHYLESLNATDAARRAGYSARSAYVEGPYLLRNARVQEAIERAVAKSVPLLRARVVEETAALAFANMGDYVEFDQGGQEIIVDADGTTTITEHPRVRVKSSDKLTRRQMAAIRKITERSTSHGRSVDFELHGKDASLDRLAKLLNMLPREGSALLPGDDREVREIKISYATGPLPDPAPLSIPLQSED